MVLMYDEYLWAGAVLAVFAVALWCLRGILYNISYQLINPSISVRMGLESDEGLRRLGEKLLWVRRITWGLAAIILLICFGDKFG